MQDTIRQEIISVVGSEDTIPQPEHKNDCHYTMAFIAEVMRFRPIFPNGVPHRSTTDTVLGGYSIPKGTMVMHPIIRGLIDQEGWTNPETFDPNRFLMDGKFSKKGDQYFAPFGVGKRSCPGNKLALLTMFFVVARLMQRTKSLGITFSIKGGNDSVGIDGLKIGAQWPAAKYSMSISE
jgi:cytochrome P450